ncbi:leucine-rich repeat protein, putative [Bodo saltans]|uniref:Leucine-rich repeat protein, putative n=1 Tax=Bodo saltans TaxID=75058 RepID=A0A0S4JBT3_BODSA|nr:leucine-rich repeat protein, putative [Bodo saltans]|eukprot:CUG89001.1 leucine-rich repeat protein, putative [Bodo saltans]
MRRRPPSRRAAARSNLLHSHRAQRRILLLPAAVQRLRLVDCVIDAAALRRLAEPKDLEHLVFMGCTFPTATGIDGIEVLASACPKLQHLVLCSCDVRNVSPLALLSQLRTIDLSGNPLLEDISPLSHLKDLEEINLNGCSLHTVAPLAACGSLWKLEVAGNPLGAPDCRRRPPPEEQLPPARYPSSYGSDVPYRRPSSSSSRRW